MRIHYLDSSVWVKRYFQEAGTERVRQLFNGREALAGSWLGCLEVAAAIARQAGARRISEANQRLIEARLDYEWSRFLQSEIAPKDFLSAVNLARRHGLRGADALHLANARRLHDQLTIAGDHLVLWTADGELIQAGRKAGLLVENPTDI